MNLDEPLTVTLGFQLAIRPGTINENSCSEAIRRRTTDASADVRLVMYVDVMPSNYNALSAAAKTNVTSDALQPRMQASMFFTNVNSVRLSINGTQASSEDGGASTGASSGSSFPEWIIYAAAGGGGFLLLLLIILCCCLVRGFLFCFCCFWLTNGYR